MSCHAVVCQLDTPNFNISVPWQITRVMVDDKNKKYYNTTIKSLQRRKSVKGYTKVLWKVGSTMQTGDTQYNKVKL